MPKCNKAELLNVTTGERLRTLRKEKQLTQEKLSESIGCVCAKQIGYIERGERELSIDLAFKFSEFFDVDVSWLMCETDFRNQSEKIRSVISTTETEGNLLYTGLWAFAELCGYDIVPPDLSSMQPGADATNAVDTWMNARYQIAKDGQKISLSPEEMNHFENLLCDLTEQAFKYLFKERSADNG